jgi:hypothetical protein
VVFGFGGKPDVEVVFLLVISEEGSGFKGVDFDGPTPGHMVLYTGRFSKRIGTFRGGDPK